MSKFNKYLKIKSMVSKAKDWRSNSTKEDSQNGKRYGKVVRVNNETLQYCGQAYAGANNYHSPDKEFTVYIEKAIKHNFGKIVDDAISYAEADLKECGENARDEIEKILKDIGGDAET